MNLAHLAVPAAVALFLGMLVLLELGRRIGNRHLALDQTGARAGVGAVEGAVFALLGLLIAFTFSGAASRFDTRRVQIVEEANAIGTAYLRLDLLPSAAQPPLRERFREYVDLRLEVYKSLPDLDKAFRALDRSIELQRDIWNLAVAGCGSTAPPCATLLLPALNQMIDIVTTRTETARMHPPWIVFALLFLLALLAALLVGYGMAGARTRSWVHVIGFAFVMSISIFFILDLEYPRFGLIRVDASDDVIVELRKSLN
jgi:hypothetical protein